MPQTNAKPPNILIYTKPDCPFCTKAKEVVRMMGWQATYLDVTKDDTARSFLHAQYLTTVPQVYVDGQYVGDYTAFEDWALTQAS